MKRRAALDAPSTPRKRKRSEPQNQLALTQTIVRRELRKRIDWKYTDYAQVAVNAIAGGVLYPLLGNMARGDTGINHFEGNIINPQALLFKYYMHTSEIRNVVRIMLLQWTDSVTPVTLGILATTTLGLGPISGTSITNKEYIKVLYDKTHQIAPTIESSGATAGEGIMQPVTVYIPGKRLQQVRFNATTDVV